MVDAVDPFLPKPIYQYRKEKAKIASPDIILDNENMSIESMSDYIFDQIGGQELLSTARNDTIASPLNINNLTITDSGTFFLNDNELPSSTLDANLQSYQININDFIPQGYSPSQIAYLDDEGNIIIELENLKSGYVVEARIVFGANTKFGTIDQGSENN